MPNLPQIGEMVLYESNMLWEAVVIGVHDGRIDLRFTEAPWQGEVHNVPFGVGAGTWRWPERTLI